MKRQFGFFLCKDLPSSLFIEFRLIFGLNLAGPDNGDKVTLEIILTV